MCDGDAGDEQAPARPGQRFPVVAPNGCRLWAERTAHDGLLGGTAQRYERGWYVIACPSGRMYAFPPVDFAALFTVAGERS